MQREAPMRGNRRRADGIPAVGWSAPGAVGVVQRDADVADATHQLIFADHHRRPDCVPPARLRAGKLHGLGLASRPGDYYGARRQGDVLPTGRPQLHAEGGISNRNGAERSNDHCKQGACAPLFIEQEFQAFVGHVDHVTIAQWMRFCADQLAIHARVLSSFHVGEEISLRPPSDHRQ
jgi:hypothetical protein